jgi:hypothetical protein
VLILRIKQAECALADGRLEEAFELVQAKDVREHRRGQELSGKIARSLVQRGRRHLEAGELALAIADCDRSGRLGGSSPELAEVRATVIAAMLEKQRAAQAQAQAVVAAHRQIEQGQLSVGQKLLSGIEDDNAQAAALRQDVQARRVMIDAVVEKAAAALKRDDWETAVDELTRARASRLTDSHLRELIAQTTRLVTQRTQEAIEAGRLDRATLLLKRMDHMADATVDGEHVRRTLEQCKAAWNAVQAGLPRAAEQIMRRLAVVLPSAKWVEAALRHLEQAGEATDDLCSGPLGLLEENGGGDAATVRPAETPRQHIPVAKVFAAPPAVRPAATTDELPRKFIVQVDGVGSFLVLRERRVRIGPISSTPAPDVGLLAEAHTPAVVVERVEDDYFLKPAGMGGADAQRGKLLTSGERIAISPRCRMTFRLPSAASTTAVLDLNSARLPRADVRHVVLMDRELILGPGPGAHMRADELPEPAVLHVKDGRLYCQTENEIRIDDQPGDRGSPIGLGRHVRVGAVTFVVTHG